MTAIARVSGATDAQAASARRLIVHGCDYLLRHPDLLDYTQDAEDRWYAILHDFRIAESDYIRKGDCSSTHTWLVMNALTHVHIPTDYVNGLRYRAGYTGTIALHGKPVHDSRNLKIGDGVLYGNGWPYEHVATALGGGIVFSHGSQPGPWKLGIDYRNDRAIMRRHI